MVPSKWWRKAASTAWLLIILTMVVGCGRQRTKMSINKTNKLIEEAERNFNGRGFPETTKLMDDAATLRQQAQTQMDTGDAKSSVVTAKTAQRTARTALDESKRLEADRQFREANADVNVMNKNNGAVENPELYQEIVDLQNSMQEKHAKQKYVATIELAREIKQKVEHLLLRLQRQANDDLVKIEGLLRQLIDEGGETHAGMYVQRVKDKIGQIQQNTNPPVKDYRTASALAAQAESDANEGIVETRRKKCEIAIDDIQRDLILAQQLQAEFFVPELWTASSEDFARLVENYWKKNYTFVLEAAGGLKKQVQNLIYQTRLASARYQRDKLDQRIAELRGKKVETYFPSRIGPLDSALQQANEKLKAEAFDDVENICKSAQLQADKIMDEFRTLSDKWIQTAGSILDRAQSVFKEMERIFSEVHPTYDKPLDQTMKDNKKAVAEDLRKRLSEAQTTIKRAQGKHLAEEYSDSIELSRAVQDEATTVLATVYHVVAHNVIAEIQDEITRYVGEGAEEFAQEELNATRKSLQEAIALRDKGDYQASIARAAVARAQLDETIETIKVTAVRAIDKARLALKEADQTKASQLRPEDYQRVQGYLIEANTQLETTRLKEAIQTAERAERLARQAAQDAARLWATQTTQEAQLRLQEAAGAGAEIYSAQMLADAAEDFRQAAKVFADGDALLGQKKFDEARTKYIEAKDLATQAMEQATRAKFRLIDEAEAAVVEARFYQAWRENLKELTESVLELNRAKEAMAQEKYDLSHELAQSASAKTRRIIASSKGRQFTRRVELIDNMLNEAAASGGRYYQPRLLASLAVELDKLREQYRAGTYDSSADRLTEVEAKLQGLLDSTPDIMGKWIANMREQLAALEKTDIPPTFLPRVSEARKFLRFAEMDFKRQKYRTSYSNLLVARGIVDELQLDRAEVEYIGSIRKVLDGLRLALEDFDHFLSLRPTVLQRMTRGAAGERRFIAIVGRDTPSEFRARIDSVMVQAHGVHPPERMAEFHKELTEVLRVARAAAINYERLQALSEFDQQQRNEIIERAYNLIQEVRDRRSKLEEGLVPRTAASQKI